MTGALAQEDSEDEEASESENEGEVDEFVEVGSEDEDEAVTPVKRGVNGIKLNGASGKDENEVEDEDEDEEEDDEDEEDEDGDEDEEETSESEYEIDEDLPEGTRVVRGADGKPRYLYPEIEPVYDTDDTDVEDENRIGDIPLSFYDQYPHIGYDINGKRIMRPATGEALDHLLNQIDLPKGWTGVIDKNTGKQANLTAEELDILKKITRNEIPEDGYDPYPVRLSNWRRDFANGMTGNDRIF